MTIDSNTKACIQKWKDAFEKHHKRRSKGSLPEDFWEGAAAYKELKKAGWLPFVMLEKYDPDGQWGPVEWAVELLQEELSFYQAKKGKVVSENQKRKDFITYLNKMEKQCEKRKKEFPQHSRILEKYIRELQFDKKRTEELAKERWKRRTEIDMAMETEGIKTPQRDSVLEGYLKVRVAFTFRFFLDKQEGFEKSVSLKTLARLVVLFYICTGLAEEKNDYLVVKRTGDELTVGGVDLILRRAGLK